MQQLLRAHNLHRARSNPAMLHAIPALADARIINPAARLKYRTVAEYERSLRHADYRTPSSVSRENLLDF